MKYLAQIDPRFRSLGLKVGTFLALLGVLLALMGALLGWRQDLFHPMVAFETAPERAEGLFAGMDITLHGIRVGRTASVKLGDDGKPLVVFQVREDAARWLREGATVRLSGLDPLGTPFLNLFPGPEEAPLLAPGSSLAFARELTIAETVAVLEGQLNPILAEAGSLVEEINRPEGDLRQALANLQTVTAALALELPPALEDARLSSRLMREFVQEISDEEADVARIRLQIKQIATQINERLPSLLQETEESLQSLRRTTAEIERMTMGTSPDVLQIVDSSRETAVKAEELVEDIRQIWFLRWFLPRKENE